MKDHTGPELALLLVCNGFQILLLINGFTRKIKKDHLIYLSMLSVRTSKDKNMIIPPEPELEDLLQSIGKAGQHLSSMGACEGAAGNISVCTRWQLDVDGLFPIISEIELPQAVPELAGSTIIVSGSGTRLRDIHCHPTANLACLVFNAGGKTARLHKARDCKFDRITSEFNSHLAVHDHQMCSSKTNFQALIHAQPIYLTYLSHISRYQDAKYLNTHLLRWQPETILNLPEGIGLIPFEVPGSLELMVGNVTAMQKHWVVIWVKHGVMVRSDVSVERAVDLLEYAETAAHYEYLNLINAEMADGLTSDEIRTICSTFSINQQIF